MAEPKKVTLNLDKLDTYVDLDELGKLEIPGAVDKFINDTKRNLEGVGAKITEEQLNELKLHVQKLIVENNKKYEKLNNG